MDEESFKKLVAEAVESLPAEFQEKLENIDVVVENLPSRSQLRQAKLAHGFTLLGLYEGVPLTRRQTSYGLVPPDKITIFQKTIEAKCGSASEIDIKAEIQRVVRHEIAHHFGIGDARLKQIEEDRGLA
jgi:predicted Zn-dependent protease with MMP-like domain